MRRRIADESAKVIKAQFLFDILIHISHRHIDNVRRIDALLLRIVFAKMAEIAKRSQETIKQRGSIAQVVDIVIVAECEKDIFEDGVAVRDARCGTRQYVGGGATAIVEIACAMTCEMHPVDRECR